MTKIIKIEKCDESCPYYKETMVHDNNPEIKCLKADWCWGGKEIPQWEEIKRPDGYITLGEYLGSKIPTWCPLEDQS